MSRKAETLPGLLLLISPAEVAKMLKAIHAQESKKASREKAEAIIEELKTMKLREAAKKVEDSIEETLTYCSFPSEHLSRIRTNTAPNEETKYT